LILCHLLACRPRQSVSTLANATSRKGKKADGCSKVLLHIWPPVIVDRSVPAPLPPSSLRSLHGYAGRGSSSNRPYFRDLCVRSSERPSRCPLHACCRVVAFWAFRAESTIGGATPGKGTAPGPRADDTGPHGSPKPAWTPPSPAFDGHRIRQSHAQQRAPRTLHCSRPCPARSMEACGLPP